jgi:hypothetical protein
MIDRGSPTWRVVVEAAKGQIEALRDHLEKSEDHARSQLIRGQIKAWRDVLALAEPKAAPKFTAKRDY